MGPELDHCIWAPHQGLKAGLKSICSFCHLPVDLPPHLALLGDGTTVVLVSSPNLESSLHHAVVVPPPSPFITICLPQSPLNSLIYLFFSSPPASPRLSHFSSIGTSLPVSLLLSFPSATKPSWHHLQIDLEYTTWITPSSAQKLSSVPQCLCPGLSVLSVEVLHNPAYLNFLT